MIWNIFQPYHELNYAKRPKLFKRLGKYSNMHTKNLNNFFLTLTEHYLVT